MKTRFLATAVLAFFSTALFAQKMTYDAGRTTFGVRGGVNFFNITGKYAGDKIDNSIKTGFHVGVNAEIPVGSGSYLQLGVLYSQKGADLKMIPNSHGLRLNYLEVPVNFVYKPVLGSGRMLLGVGPYVGVGIGGKQKSGSNETDVKFTNDYITNNNQPQYQRLDYGGNLLAGYEFANNLSFQLNAQLGLANITPNVSGTDNKTKQNNTGFGVSVGYRF